MTIPILIADDEVIERRVLRRKLENYFGSSLSVTEAANGREVLEAFHQAPALRPQIYILDIEMPGITGLDAAKAIREEGDGSAAIIFLTAFDDFNYARRAISVRAMDYLLKPCDEKELLSTVEEAVRTVTSRVPEPVPQKESPAENVPSGVSAPKEAAKSRVQSGSRSSGQAEIRRYIEDNYGYDLSVQDMAERLGYSEAYFCRLFRQNFGQSFVSYLTEYRIREAARRLKETSDSIGDIGKAVGYPDPNYFARVFRRITGHTPSEFRAHPTSRQG